MNLELNNGENLYVPENDKKYILAKLIVEAEAELGYSLTYDEAKKLPRMPKDLNVYALYFGSFKKACDTASVVVKRKEHPEQAGNYGYRRWIMDKREEILSRVMELSFNEHGNKIDWLDEKAIKRDSILVLSEVMKAFGGVRQLREVAKERLRREKYRKKTREIEEVEKMSEEKKTVETTEAATETTEVTKATEVTEEVVVEKKRRGRPKRAEAQPEKVDEQPGQIEQESQKSQIGQTIDQIVGMLGEDGKIAQLSKLLPEIGVSVNSDGGSSKSYLLEYGGLTARVDITIY